MYDTDNLAPSTPVQYAFVNTFQSAVLALIASLPAGTGVFSSTCLVHCLSGQPSFQALTVNNVSMSEALNAWYFDAEPTSVVSTCSGWPCTAACGATNNGIPCVMGTGYKATQCFALDVPTSIPDEPGPANSTTGVPIPGDGTDSSAAPSGPAVSAASVFGFRSAAVGSLGASSEAASAKRKSSHDATVFMGATALLAVAGAVLCMASRQAAHQALPAERRPLLPQL